MSKLYADEMDDLPGTYAWALQADIHKLRDVIASIGSLPLLSVGSGGAFTVASFAAVVHQECTGKMAKAITPLDIDLRRGALSNCAVMLFSAGGSNPDILGLFKRLIVQEPRRLIIVCARRATPLANLAARYWYTDIVEYEPPCGRDGFLATNSLLTFAVLLRRAYAMAFSIPQYSLPRTLGAFVHPGVTLKSHRNQLRKMCMSLWPRHHLIVLFGADSRCGAIDLESKLTESALGAVQLADYRNFAHGRHHWLAKRASTTGVLAYVSSHDKILAERTLQLLPGEVPIVRIGLRHEGIDANLEAAIVALWLTACAGEAHHVNAGRPGVPKFGREIYHLHAFGRSASGSSSSVESTAIERKVGTSITTLQKRSALAFWRDKYRAFIRTLRRSEFSGIVLDYDGTLCDGRDRFVGWSAEMASEVVRLLQAGIHVAIATGRGESVRTDLRGRIPEERWTRVLVGYCNGAEVHPLSSERPVCRGKQMALLKGIVQAIQQNPALRQTVKYKVYPSQISLRPKSPVFGDYVWEALQDLMPVREHPTIQVVRSDHSIDILAPGVSKTRILDCMRSLIGVPGARILCIGDKGRWPGNDSGLLSQALSLSVDEVSRSPETCWNIAPLGYRGAQATLYYLRHLDPVCMAALPGCRCRLPGGRK